MICFPLDNTPYEAKDMGTYLATRTRGVFSSDGNLAVTPGESGLSVSVSPGLAWLKWSDYWGTAALQEQALTLDLDTADGALKRIDAIVCRLDKVNNRAEIVVKKGAPSSAPIVVPPVRDANYDELYIATVLIGAGVISISASAITDQRLNEEYCGLMRDGITGIPTASLHAQAQQILTELTAALNAQIVRQSAEFDAWFDDLKGKLGEDPATALQLQVDNLNAAVVGDAFQASGTPVSIAYAGTNRIASITAYGETPQGGTTEAPVALTGVDSVFVGGKNLLPKATKTQTIYGVTFTPNPDGSVSVSGTCAGNIATYNYADNLVPISPNQVVYLSGASQLVKVVINEKTPSGAFVRNVLVDRGQGISGTLTKQKEENILYATLQVQIGDTPNLTIYPMLNLGKSPLSYEPYSGSITALPIPRPLHKADNSRDVCVTRVKSIYDKRIVIDQNSAIVPSGEPSIVGTSRRFDIKVTDLPPTLSTSLGKLLCNRLPQKKSSETYEQDVEGVSIQNDQYSQNNIQFRVHGCKTEEAIKAWLTDNPLIVYYQSTAYDGTNGLDVCLTEYQTGFVELDGTESNLEHFPEYENLAINGVMSAGSTTAPNVYGTCMSSHFAMVPVGASPLPENTVFGQPKYNRIIIHTSKWNSLETARTYLAAQKAAGTPVQIAYQLATPEVYATDPLDFDNAEGPLVIMTGGEVKAAFKSADKVVESRIDFVEDTLNEQGQAIAEKAPISHSSDKSTYGLGSGSQFGHVKLSDATASGSNAGQGIAATPSAVNQVNARVSTVDGIARAAMPKSGGTFTGNVLASSANEAGAFLRNISVQNSASQLQYTNFIIMVRK
ncbi:hypothetical protein [Ruthenibacterium lactatiformans]|uniref:hypothetical protein n=1 Tax=Ruthenibacterium lactatiformans TaxID=1550024 RepID=UPI002672157D|nr:hypothetical protein [Ruthenibacterium lactatiformans]